MTKWLQRQQKQMPDQYENLMDDLQDLSESRTVLRSAAQNRYRNFSKQASY